MALFTSVEEADARAVLVELDHRGHLPPGFLARLEYVEWAGEHKDLQFVLDANPSEVLLVDDDGGWVRGDQKDRWVSIAPWDGGADNELQRVLAVLEQWLANGEHTTE